MQEYFNHPISISASDDESTNLKCLNVIDTVSDASQSKVIPHRTYSLSECSSENSENTTATTPLCRPSTSSMVNESFEDTYPSSNAYASCSSSNHYCNYRMQQRTLPSTPKNRSAHPRCSYCRSTSSSSNGRYVQSLGERRSSHIKRRCLVIITIVAVVLSVCSSALICLTLVYKGTLSLEDDTLKDGNYETCIPCAQLPDDDDGNSMSFKKLLTTKVSDKTVLCCASTSGQMSALMQMIMNQNQNKTVPQTPLRQTVRFSPVSAHKHLHPWSMSDFNEPTFESTRYHLKMSPTNDVSSEHFRHVTARKNSLEIIFSGWYLVYSSVYFKPMTDRPCGQLRHQTWGHFISRNSPNRMSTTGTLVQSAHTCCDNCTEDHHTSYAAGVFLLEAGDNVYVEVSGSGLVLFDGEGSYLGLVMLGSWDSGSNNDLGSANNIKGQ